MTSNLIRIVPWTGPHRRLDRVRNNPDVVEFKYPHGDRVLEGEADLSARKLIETRKLLCTMHASDLIYTDRFHERGLFGTHTFLTDQGEQALVQLNQGLSWSVERREVDLDHSRKFWERFLKSLRYDRDDLQRVRAITHPDFQDIWSRLTYRIMGANCRDGVWDIPLV